jgi:hypothetical protein
MGFTVELTKYKTPGKRIGSVNVLYGILYVAVHTGNIEEMTLDFNQGGCPFVIVDVDGHQTLCVEWRPADEEGHNYSH